jgi:mono/diheme cytochrome c family protein
MDSPSAPLSTTVTAITVAAPPENHQRRRKLLSSVIAKSLALTFAAFATNAHAMDGAEAKKLFNQRCTACHTFGKGVKVGPDLKGVTERHPRRWLLSFIRGPQRLIQSGDAAAVALFRQFKQERMPDWSDLSPEQVTGLLEWFAASGPEQREPDERNAELATAAEVGQGRRLFHGDLPQATRGPACAACHAIQDGASSSFARLAPDLTSAYLAYRDRALTLFLKSACFPREPLRSGEVLTASESYLIKAYLRDTALHASGPLAAPAGRGGHP